MGFFSFFKRKEKSKDVAKERLKLVLVHDRSDISPKFLESIKADILEVISKYAEVEKEGLDIKVTRMKKKDSTTISALVANIPFSNTKDNSNG